MFVTIAIPTYNNAQLLDSALQSLYKLHCPDDIDYEILVIDNNSNDRTPLIIRKNIERFNSKLKSVFEPKQGLSFARNRALKEAKGQIVCFLDDDVIVAPGWLEAVTSAFSKYSAAVVGGRSYLIYPGQKPYWLPHEREMLLSALDYGNQTLVNTDKELFGLNFSIRKELALKLGGFNTALGRKAKSLSCGEETELLDRVRKAGGVAVYEPRAIVGHIVKKKRLKKSWMFRRIFEGAVSKERQQISQGKIASISTLFVQTARCWASVIKSIFNRYSEAEIFFEKQYFATYNLGRLVATIRFGTKNNSRKI